MKKRSLLFILLSLFTFCLFAQEKDRRAELAIGTNEISISPDERIFIVTNRGEIYFAENIYSSFNKINHLFYSIDSNDEYNSEYPNLDRISFFNNDTAIITGYIQSSKKKYSKENGYYFTTNSANDVKNLCFDKREDEWIYDVFSMSDGNAWMGGSEGNIYHTSNFGKSWKKLNSPFGGFFRLNSIYMININEGIAGGSGNRIYSTKDNWRHYSKIETPLDQKLYENHIRFLDNKIYKIIAWNNYYIVNQDNKTFYSEKDNIKWKRFILNNIDIQHFEVDKNSNNLFAVTKENKVIQFENFETYKIISSQKIIGRIDDMKVVNNTIYLVFSNFPFNYETKIAKINSKEFFQTYLFTDEKKIEIKNKIINGENLQWTFNENYIYITETGKQDWYREAQLDYTIRDLFLLNDSTAIIWNGKNNYLYSTSTKKDIPYHPQNPLSSFLLYPINKIELKEGVSADGVYRSNLVDYNLTDSMLTTSKLTNENHLDTDDIIFNNQVNVKDATEILQQFNNNSQDTPQLKNYNITDKDKKEYILLLDSLFFGKRYSEYKYYKKDTLFFYDFINYLDTISQHTLNNVITKDLLPGANVKKWFEVNIINSNNDTIKMFNYWYKPNAFYFPFTIKYKEQYINSYNLPLSLLIKKLYPFTDKFENKNLLLEIVTYLYSKRNDYQ